MQLVLCRIDDRLIHGQFTTQWLPQYPADTLYVVDDAVAHDAFLSDVMRMLAPAGLRVLLQGTQDAAAALLSAPASQRAILLVKTPLTLCALQQRGVRLATVSLGGMGLMDDRTMLYKNIAASPAERQALRSLIEHGCTVQCQVVPGDRPVDVSPLL